MGIKVGIKCSDFCASVDIVYQFHISFVFQVICVHIQNTTPSISLYMPIASAQTTNHHHSTSTSQNVCYGVRDVRNTYISANWQQRVHISRMGHIIMPSCQFKFSILSIHTYIYIIYTSYQFGFVNVREKHIRQRVLLVPSSSIRNYFGLIFWERVLVYL